MLFKFYLTLLFAVPVFAQAADLKIKMSQRYKNHFNYPMSVPEIRSSFLSSFMDTVEKIDSVDIVTKRHEGVLKFTFNFDKKSKMFSIDAKLSHKKRHVDFQEYIKLSDESPNQLYDIFEKKGQELANTLFLRKPGKKMVKDSGEDFDKVIDQLKVEEKVVQQKPIKPNQKQETKAMETTPPQEQIVLSKVEIDKIDLERKNKQYEREKTRMKFKNYSLAVEELLASSLVENKSKLDELINKDPYLASMIQVANFKINKKEMKYSYEMYSKKFKISASIKGSMDLASAPHIDFHNDF